MAFIRLKGMVGLVSVILMIMVIEGFSLEMLIARRIVFSELIGFIIVSKRFGLIILIGLIRLLLMCNGIRLLRIGICRGLDIVLGS